MPIAPQNPYPEKPDYVYERKIGENYRRRGPLRFEEGVATDTDVPNDFQRGMYEGSNTVGRGKVDPETQFKHAEETMQERAHVGSASWIEAPTVLNEFVQGSDEPPQVYGRVINPEMKVHRINPVTVDE